MLQRSSLATNKLVGTNHTFATAQVPQPLHFVTPGLQYDLTAVAVTSVREDCVLRAAEALGAHLLDSGMPGQGRP